MTGVARMTSKGSVSHILLVYNLFKLLTVIFYTKSQDTDIIIAHNSSKTASLMLVARKMLWLATVTRQQ